MTLPRVRKILAKCQECERYFWSYVAYGVDGGETFEQVDSLNLCSDCRVKNGEPLGKKPTIENREEERRRALVRKWRERRPYTRGLFDE